MAQQRVGVKVKMCGLLTIYMHLLLIGLHQQPTLAYFEGCDHMYSLTAPVSYLQSPYYANNYPPGSSCRYQFNAPTGYQIAVKCTIELEKNPTSCSTEFFYISTTGDPQLSQSEQFCGDGTVERTSVSNSIVMAYISYGQKGRFSCSLTLLAPCDCGWSMNTRIVNGQNANANEVPSMVALAEIGSNQQSFCGGSIIALHYAVTACHCFDAKRDISTIRVLVGDHNLATSNDSPYARTYAVSQIIKHPAYNADTNANDIALVRTTADFVYSRGVGPICLPFSSNNYPQNFDYQDVTIMGWGTTSFAGPPSTVLQKAYQRILPNSICQNEYPTVNVGQICTYDYTNNRRDSCQWDSGGPVIKLNPKQYLVGVISYGFGCGSQPNSTSVNTRITSHLEWIQSQLDGPVCKKPLP